MAKYQINDDELLELAKKSKNATMLWKSMGYKSHCSYTKYIGPRLIKLGFAGFPKNTNHKFSDEQLLMAAKNADSITDVMRKLGLNIYGGRAHKSFKDRLINLGIDVCRFPKRNGSKSGPRREISEYLVKDGVMIISSKLRKRLITGGLKKQECEKCRNPGEWLRNPLQLHLHHIDGDTRNNQLENLIILCPNCHTQTPNYGKIKNALAGN